MPSVVDCRRYPWVSVLLLLCLLGVAVSSPAADDGEMLIRLQQAQFDPSLSEPRLAPELTLGSPPRSVGNYYLVQFEGPIRAEWRARLEGLGAQVMDYVPDFAYIVRMDEGARAPIEALDEVRWSGLYQPAFRLDSELEQRALRASGKRVELVARGFTGEPVAILEAELARLGADVISQGRDTGGGVIFRLYLLDTALLDLAHVPGLAWIEPYRQPEFSNEVARSDVSMNKDGVESVLGLYGLDQIVAVGDTGLSTGDANTVHQDFEGRVFGGNTGPGSSCGGWADNHSHGTHVAGSVLGSGFHSGADIANHDYAGSNAGIAPEALVYAWSFCNDFSGLPDDAYNDYYGVIHNVDPRARVNNNSWGYTTGQGGYNTFTRETDRFVWDFPDMVLTYAAGNAGTDANGDGVVDENSTNMPSTAKNVITVGASENLRMEGGYNPGGACSTWGGCWPSNFPADPVNSDRLSDDPSGMVAFSSRGPTNSGRLKPDVVAAGSNIVSTRNESTGTGWGIFDTHYIFNGGTSMAAPLVAGASAIVREYYQTEHGVDPSAALVKATLINGAFDMTPGQYGEGATQDVTARPDINQGWGRVDLVYSLVYDDSRGLEFVEHAGLQTGEDYELSLFAGDQAPLRITLVWSDFPGTEASGGALTNDLDLQVAAPGGTIYVGNALLTGGDPDRVNNVEGVDLDLPVSGEYTITISGFNVPEGPQPFVLVISGNFGGFSVDPDQVEVCAADGSTDFTLSLSDQFQGTTDLSVSGEPAGATGAFSLDPVVFPATDSVYTLSGLGAVAGGDYTLAFTATDADDVGNTATQSAALTVFEDNPGQVILSSPADGANNVDLQPEFGWGEVTQGAAYQIQVATDDGFADIVIDESVAQASFIPAGTLATGTDFFWRVRANNTCGDGDWSAAFAFQTRFEPQVEAAPDAFVFELPQNDSASQVLSISNIGTGSLDWDLAADQPASIPGLLAHDPALDEAFDLPDFTVLGAAANPPVVELSIDAGVLTRGDVVGFSFAGTAAGVSGNGSWASDTCLVIEAPDGTTYGVGGISPATISGCGDENSWDFQGSGSDNDGAYQSAHDDVFEPSLADQGTWTLTFVNDWASTNAADIAWSDVTLTLHKQPLPVCVEEPFAGVSWLSTSADSGSTPGGGTDAVDVMVDTTGLTTGLHEAYLCLTSNAENQPLIPIPVTVNVTGHLAVAAITPNAFSFEVPQGDSGSDVMNIANTGTADLQWSLHTTGTGRGPSACDNPADISWLSTSVDSGTTPPGDSEPVDVMVDTGNLDEGEYQALLCATSNDPATPLIEIPVMLTVSEPGSVEDGVFSDRFEQE